MKKRKKLLAIHSNKIFFKKDAPNFYEWICGRRALNEPYQVLKKEYSNGEKDPRVLEETFCLAIAGLTPVEFRRYIKEYRDKYKIKKIAKILEKLSKRFEIIIFSSLPKDLFYNFSDITKIFGSKYYFCDKKYKIDDLDSIQITNLKMICKKFDELGEGKNYGFIPDRYGMLAYLIDEMIKGGYENKDVIVLGKGVTAKPMRKMAGRIIENLEELN